MGEVGHQIVIAEPEEEQRAALRSLIESLSNELELDLRCAEAADGPEALRHLEREGTRIYLGEVLLEGFSGLELMRRIRKSATKTTQPSPKFFFITTMDGEVDRYWALRNGADAYLVKPYSEEQLRTKLHRILPGEFESERS